MKLFFSIIPCLFLFSCGSSIQDEDILGCWELTYIDTDGVKMKAGNYSICFNEDGTLVQQRYDGTEKIAADWSLEEEDSLIIFHYEDRKPDTFNIIKSDKRELHIRKKIKLSKVTLYLRKQK